MAYAYNHIQVTVQELNDIVDIKDKEIKELKYEIKELKKSNQLFDELQKRYYKAAVEYKKEKEELVDCVSDYGIINAENGILNDQKRYYIEEIFKLKKKIKEVENYIKEKK